MTIDNDIKSESLDDITINNNNDDIYSIVNRNVLKLYNQQNNDLCDTLFIVGNNDNICEFHVISTLFCINSEVFKNMLNGQMLESQKNNDNNNKKIVYINDINPDGFKFLISYFYNLKPILNNDIVIHIIYISKKYLLNKLKLYSLNYIINNINCIDILYNKLNELYNFKFYEEIEYILDNKALFIFNTKLQIFNKFKLIWIKMLLKSKNLFLDELIIYNKIKLFCQHNNISLNEFNNLIKYNLINKTDLIDNNILSNLPDNIALNIYKYQFNPLNMFLNNNNNNNNTSYMYRTRLINFIKINGDGIINSNRITGINNNDKILLINEYGFEYGIHVWDIIINDINDIKYELTFGITNNNTDINTNFFGEYYYYYSYDGEIILKEGKNYKDIIGLRIKNNNFNENIFTLILNLNDYSMLFLNKNNLIQKININKQNIYYPFIYFEGLWDININSIKNDNILINKKLFNVGDIVKYKENIALIDKIIGYNIKISYPIQNNSFKTKKWVFNHEIQSLN